MSDFGDTIGFSGQHALCGGAKVCAPWWSVRVGLGFGNCKGTFEIYSIGLREDIAVVCFGCGSSEIENLFEFIVVLVSSEVLDQDGLGESLCPHP